MPADTGVRWCRSCGIPHAPETAYCGNCGTPLAEDPLAAAALPPGSATMLTPHIPSALLPLARPSQAPSRGAIARRLRQPTPLSDAEVEAAAAALVREAQLLPATAPDLDLPPLAESEAAALRMSERDRRWLAAGFVCCLLLIAVAITFARFLGSAPVGP